MIITTKQTPEFTREGSGFTGRSHEIRLGLRSRDTKRSVEREGIIVGYIIRKSSWKRLADGTWNAQGSERVEFAVEGIGTYKHFSNCPCTKLGDIRKYLRVQLEAQHPSKERTEKLNEDLRDMGIPVTKPDNAPQSLPLPEHRLTVPFHCVVKTGGGSSVDIYITDKREMGKLQVAIIEWEDKTLRAIADEKTEEQPVEASPEADTSGDVIISLEDAKKLPTKRLWEIAHDSIESINRDTARCALLSLGYTGQSWQQKDAEQRATASA